MNLSSHDFPDKKKQAATAAAIKKMQSHKNSHLNARAFFCSSIVLLLEDKSEGIAGKRREIIYESILKIAEGISAGELRV